MNYTQELRGYISDNLINKLGNPNAAVLRRDWFKESPEFQQILHVTEWLNDINSDCDPALRVMMVHHNITTFPKCERCGDNVRYKKWNKFSRFCSKRCSCRSSLKLRQSNESVKYDKLKESTTLFSLDETTTYIESKLNKSGQGNSERESVYNGFYHSIMHYSNELVGMEFNSFLERMFCLHNNIDIIPKCKNPNCSNDVNWNQNHYNECCSVGCQSSYTAPKRLETYLTKTGYSHPHKNPEVKAKMVKHCIEKFGVDHQFKDPNVRSKMKVTKLRRYGDEKYNNPKSISETWKDICSNHKKWTEIKSKRQFTSIEKYGVPFYPNVDKRKSTNMRKYGVPSFANVDKRISTCMRRYGVPFYANVDKRISTCMRRYGVPFYANVDKRKSTCMKRYGVPFYSQSNLASNGYKWKDYELPSGKIIRIQGYENFLLDELLEHYSEDKIKTSRKDMPEFWYELDGKTRRYFPDVFIPETNTIYEVKSEYTLGRNIEMNKMKFQSVLDSGCNFELKVY